MLDATSDSSNGVKELNLSMQGFVRLALSVWLCIFSVLAPTDAAAASADLTVTKSHVGNFARGQLGAAYTITVTNVGAGTSDGTVSLTDTLPPGLNLSSGPLPIGGTGWLCFFGSLTCTRLPPVDPLAPGASYPKITLLVDVAVDAPASVINTVTISGGGDTNAPNNTATDPTTILPADLAVTKTHVGNFARGQLGAAYTIMVTNVGAGTADGTVSLTDTLPPGLTLSTGPLPIGGIGWLCFFGSLTCTRLAMDTLAPAASYPPITLLVDVALDAPASVINTVAISGGGDTNAANNAANDATTILPADLAVTKTHVDNFVRGQVGAPYTITVSNVGAGTSDGTVSLTDTLPVGLTLTPGPNSFGGAGWLCFFGSLTCTRLATDTLAPAASYPPITLLVDVSSNASASLINTVTISGGGDTNAANNTANDATLIAGPPAFSGAASRRAHGGAGTFDLPLAP